MDEAAHLCMSPAQAALLVSLWSLHTLLAAATTTLLTLKFAPQPHFVYWVAAIWFIPYLGTAFALLKLLLQPRLSQAEADQQCPASAPPFPTSHSLTFPGRRRG